MQNHFNNKIYNFQYKEKDIDSTLQDSNYLIVGDFWGIQSFIFDGLSTKNAAKVLRAKSAYVQILMEVVAKYICDQAGVRYEHILTTNAGKFEVLLPKEFDVESLQKKLDSYFLKNFYGLSGIGLVGLEVSKNEWQKSYKVFREKVAKAVEAKKFQKFDLINTDCVLEYEQDLDNQNLCPICNIRKKRDGKEECKICKGFIDFGKRLADFTKEEFVSNIDLKIDIFEGFECDVVIDRKLVSYVPTNDKDILTFEQIANNSCEKEKGIKALGILKADVDGMGSFIKEKESKVTDSFENFDEFSKGIDSFFSLHVTDMLKQKYKNIYTVFAGGDDLFLVGAWDEVMEFAREIREKFKTYINNKLSISFGIAIAKPSTPISYLANHTEELLEASKEVEGKDALTIWDEHVKWDSYLEVYVKLDIAFKDYKNIATTTIYRLLEFCSMSKKAKNGDIKATIWKSKLNYLFSRNMDINKEKDKKLMEILSKSIDKNPKETKLFLNEFIYKRREG